ncbi:Heat shock protein 75 kDa, mitochondrial [Zancudomyces culisetae]|uniref:Heat shock protein 75 kDa, mitochondrial n=1 Tax=Zancudomyces culisetae TaxID=1213189 RepID=A0A1R1PND6_ZANCU|nr:Heat shock protein 75 kDa, mitochondrial [Zancudomyces culisetae]|eukprot:OMH82464.1 Heat shock protein 75 kDa, mitochondrial [Zancudomyces culisetae]
MIKLLATRNLARNLLQQPSRSSSLQSTRKINTGVNKKFNGPATVAIKRDALARSSGKNMREYSTGESGSSSQQNVHEFKAETKKLLNIVAHSLYSQREVFVRELISNASDALEKLRYLQATNSDAVVSGEHDTEKLKIEINVDKENKKITIHDYGIGMTKNELVENLGTIAKSGSKAYIEEQLKQRADGGGDSKDETVSNIVGQFGVGFYSGFMVGDSMEVISKSSKANNATHEDNKAYLWKSEGLGTYTLEEVDSDIIGTKITINIKDDAKEFLDEYRIKEIVKKYSNFVGFPITVNGEQVNTIEAIWLKDKRNISDKEFDDFYKFITRDYDTYKYNLVYKTDSPLSIKAILYIPKTNSEMLYLEKTKTAGLSLYSRKVLIMSNCDKVLPEWLRFVKGVVDSEDLPLNLSRELLQQGRIITRLRDVLTSRVIKWLKDEARFEPEKYVEFYRAFGNYIKEGVFYSTDGAIKDDLISLLRFETLGAPENDKQPNTPLTSVDEYISRNKGDNIYYLCSPNRKYAEENPYYEPFKSLGVEVLLLTKSVDDHMMNSIANGYKKQYKFISIDSSQAKAELEKLSNIKKSEVKKDDDASNDVEKKESPLTESDSLSELQREELVSFLLPVFGPTRIKKIGFSSYLTKHPAVLTDFMSPSLRKMMLMMAESTNDQASGSTNALPMEPCNIELSPSHPVILKLYKLKDSDPQLASLIAEQVCDNAFISAGLMDDPRSMLTRLNDILMRLSK